MELEDYNPFLFPFGIYTISLITHYLIQTKPVDFLSYDRAIDCHIKKMLELLRLLVMLFQSNGSYRLINLEYWLLLESSKRLPGFT